VAAIGGLLAGAGALLARWVKRRRLAAQRRALEAKAVRYLLDAQRQTLNVLIPGASRSRLIDLGELNRQKLLIDDVREELWIADGHESSREAERVAQDVLKVLTRTQAIEAARAQKIRAAIQKQAGGEGQDMFRQGEED